MGATIASNDYWFYGDSRLQGMSGWVNVRGLQSMHQAFNGCAAIAGILVDSTWALASNASGMSTFYNCTSIVGGNGTVYSSSAASYERMVVDQAEQAGYLTRR